MTEKEFHDAIAAHEVERFGRRVTLHPGEVPKAPDNPMTDDELKTWALAHTEGPMRSPLAAGVLRLLEETGRLRNQIAGHVERIAAQSELLSRRAENPVTFRGAPIVSVQELWAASRPNGGPPAPEDESHLDGHDPLSAPSLLGLADDGCPHAGEPD